MIEKVTPILFLDLDGTVRLGHAETGKYVNGPEDVDLFDGMYELINSYKQRGWRICAISNQGGIALGHVTDSQVNKAMLETNRLTGNAFDRMNWCVHHPDAQLEEDSKCFCRKPSPGLVISAMTSLSLQYHEYFRPFKALFVGDLDEDKKCAESINMPFMWARDWRARGPLTDITATEV